MKTPDITEAMPSAHDSADFTKWYAVRKSLIKLLNGPELDVPFGPEWVAWIFDYSLEKAKAEQELVCQLLSKIDPFELWRPSTLDRAMEEPCRLLGWPFNADRHQQPSDLRRLFGVPLSGASLFEYMNDEFDSDRPLEWMTPELFTIWRRWLIDRGRWCQSIGVPIQDRMEWVAPSLKLIGMRLLAFACPEGLAGRLESLFNDCDYLKFTSGCFDMTSGDLTEDGLEIAALREFIMIRGAA
jgi:hypothetical protein